MNNESSHNYKKINDSRNKNKMNIPIVSLKSEEEELLYLMKKCNLVDNIVQTEQDLLKNNSQLKKRNLEQQLNNQILLSQVDSVYNKIYQENSFAKQNKKKLHDFLFNFSENIENSFRERQKLLQNKYEQRKKSIKKKLLPKIVIHEQNKINQINNMSKKNLLTSSNVNKGKEDESMDGRSFSYSKKNILRENSKKYYLIKGNKNMENNVKNNKLPPINKSMFKYHKLKLSVNNQIDLTDQKHEDMMKMYKELELRNKRRFMI